MTLEELKARLGDCDMRAKRSRDEAFKRFEECGRSNRPHSDQALQGAFCQGQLLGELKQINLQREQCYADAMAEFFAQP